jgi:hypothetical protein
MKNLLLPLRTIPVRLFSAFRFWLLFLALLPAYRSFSQTLYWARAASGTHSQAYGTTVDQNGNVYTTGYFQGTVDFDPGPGVFNITSSGQDAFVQKLNAAGNLVWAMRLGGPSNDIPTGITVDSFGHVYVIGTFGLTVDFDPGPGVFNLTAPSFDAFVLRLDTAGNFGWVKRLGGPKQDYAYDIRTDNSGNVYVSGAFRDTADFDPSGGVYNLMSIAISAGYLVKLDSSGNFVFAKRLGSNSIGAAVGCNPYRIALDKYRNIFLAGHFQGTSDFDPGPGSFTLTSLSSGSPNAFFCKLDSSGNFLWAKLVGGVGQTFIYGLGADSSGSVFAAGAFSYTTDLDPGAGTYNITSVAPGSLNAFTEKLDAVGNFVWGNQLPSTIGSQNMALCLDRSGSVYISGTFSNNVDFDPGPGTFYMISAPSTTSTYIQKLDNNGNLQKAIMIDANNFAETRSIAVDRKKNIYLAGGIQGTADFDPGPGTVTLSSLSNMSMTVSKFSQRKFDTDTVTACGSYTIQDHTHTSSGTYLDTLIASDGPDSIVTLDLTVHPLPSAGTVTGVDTLCKSTSTTLTASVTGGTWSTNDASIAGVSSGGVVTGTAVGLDTVIYTVTDASTGCSATVIHPIYIKNCQNNPNDIGTINSAIDFGIIPNPNNGNFKISLASGNNDAVVSITNISGQEVFRGAVIDKEYNLAPELPEGMYLVRITSGNATQVQKMIIAR